MNVLSLFDGLSCGMIAMKNAGVQVDRYVAYEIDKYAIKVSTHNFPEIEQKGDVFTADFTEYDGFDWLIGGSPCTYWSIAQKNNRETEASGLGWELFSQYVRALHEAKPKYFIYENNKSMAKAIRDSIRETFGFEEICINSALLSAQNRQRYYWVGKRNEDGTYSKVDVQQPEDRGILLRDVLDGAVAWQDKAYAYTTRCQGAMVTDTLERHRHTMVAEPLPASSVLNLNPSGNGINGSVSRIDTKSRCLTTNKGEGQKIIVPVSPTGSLSDLKKIVSSMLPTPVNTTESEKAYGLTAHQGGRTTANFMNGGGHFPQSGVAEPVNITDNGKSQTLKAQYNKNSVANFCCYSSTYGATGVAEPVGTTKDGKSFVLTANYRFCNGGDYVTHTLEKSVKTMVADPVPQYAIPCEWDSDSIPTKAISGADGKTYTVYSVQNGQITIKDKTYPIKLIDGYYIIRKLTVSECKRLQTVPEWYDFSVISNSQAYKCLGNGWTCDVITHLINACLK